MPDEFPAFRPAPYKSNMTKRSPPVAATAVEPPTEAAPPKSQAGRPARSETALAFATLDQILQLIGSLDRASRKYVISILQRLESKGDGNAEIREGDDQGRS